MEANLLSDTITPNLKLTKPEVGGSDDTWGDKTNANWDIMDLMQAAIIADVPPAINSDGTFWVDSNTQILYVSVGGVWQEIALSAPPAGSVGTSALADGAVTTPKLADGAVTTPKLANGAVTNAQLAPNSVNSANIVDGSITAADMANMAAYTIRGNPGAASDIPHDFTIPGLTNKSTPVGADLIMISDSGASGALKQIQISSLSGGGSTVYISDTAPVGKPANSLWWESDTGMLYVNYLDPDATSPVWVSAMPTPDPSALVRVDTAQTFTAAQQAQARSNIYAAPFDALAFSGMQVNGSCDVSQERGTTSYLPNTTNYSGYVQDGWVGAYESAGAALRCSFFPAGSVGTAIPGISNGITIQAQTPQATLASSAYAILSQSIEGYRVARVAWGTANAQPVSIAFWVQASISGVLPVAIRNASGTRSYVANVQINNANTWEFKTLTIPGDTAGTWNKDNTIGMVVSFAMCTGSGYQGAVGSWQAGNFIGSASGANFAATANNVMSFTGLIVLPGIELPSASRAPFIMRSFDQELLTCQRYYEKSYDYGTVPGTATTNGCSLTFLSVLPSAAYQLYVSVPFAVSKRAVPSPINTYSTTSGAIGKAHDGGNNADVASTIVYPGTKGFTWYAAMSAALNNYNLALQWTADARL